MPTRAVSTRIFQCLPLINMSGNTLSTYRTRAPVLHQTCRNRFCDSLWSFAKCLYEFEDFLEADAKRGSFQIYSGGPPTKAKRGELEKEEEIRR